MSLLTSLDVVCHPPMYLNLAGDIVRTAEIRLQIFNGILLAS